MVALSRWVGPDGGRALMTRALRRASIEHALLERIEVAKDIHPALLGLETIEDQDEAAISAALMATLTELFELLARLIGNELTLKIADQIQGGRQHGALGEEQDDG